MNKANRFKTYASLFASFFKIGLVTFGGGLAMLPLLKRDLVDCSKSFYMKIYAIYNP